MYVAPHMHDTLMAILELGVWSSSLYAVHASNIVHAIPFNKSIIELNRTSLWDSFSLFSSRMLYGTIYLAQTAVPVGITGSCDMHMEALCFEDFAAFKKIT